MNGHRTQVGEEDGAQVGEEDGAGDASLWRILNKLRDLRQDYERQLTEIKQERLLLWFPSFHRSSTLQVDGIGSLRMSRIGPL